MLVISYKEAINKANKYLYDADAPVVITLHGRFAEGWFFASSPGNTLKPETTLPVWQETLHSSSIKIVVKSLI